MHGLFIIALLALPLLFPEAMVPWLQAAQAWLARRRTKKGPDISA